MAQVHDQVFADVQVTSSDIEIRKIHLRDLWHSLKEGYDDFNANPTFGVFLVVVYPLFAILFTLTLMGTGLLYLAFPMVAGLTLLGPVVSVAIFEMSRRRELGLDPTWRSAFGFVHTSAFAPIVALSIIMMLLYVGWLFMAQFIYFGRFGTNPPASMSAFVTELFTTERGAALILYGNAVGFIFAFCCARHFGSRVSVAPRSASDRGDGNLDVPCAQLLRTRL